MGGHRLSKYPILYKGDATDFFTLGLGPIQMLKATVTQERNGIFIFEGEILTDSPLFPLVLENYIIKADADHFLKDQRFRIKRIVPNHDGKAEIYAEHVSYLSRELTIKPEVSITGSAQTALSQWKASIVEPNLFVVDSDIPTSNKTKWRIDKVENPRMALGGVEGSILDVWGGEYRFDNYHISLLQKRGTTAKTVLAYGRNITDFEQERNIANTYTSIMPYAIYNDANDNEVLVHIDGYVVDSEHINKYPNRVVQAVNFSSEFEHDEVPTKVRLLALANHYIKANEIGVPSTSIKVSFVDLSKSPDYAEYAFLEQVNLCDDVRVYYPKLGVNTVAKVIRTVWNVLTESYDEIEIGQKRMSLVGQMQQQQQAIKEINTQTNYAMTSADGKNTIFYGLYGENGLGEPKAIKVGDTWYKPNGTGTDMLVWTGTIWQVVLNAETFNQINEKIDQAEKDIITTTELAQSGVDKANQAVLDAGFAEDLANDAKSIAVQASADVVNVKATADQAKADASTSLTNAQNALNKAIKSSVIHYALSANGTTPPATGWQTSNPNPTADQYVWTRTTITLNDNSPIVSYSVGKIGSKGDKGDIGLKGDTGLPGVNAPKIISVKEQYYLSTSNASPTGGSWVDTVPTWSSGKYYWLRVSTTFDNATTTLSTPVLDAALNQSLVKTLEVQTATQNLSATVTQHATLIESKVNSATVDAIAGRVTNAEGSISTIAGKVELKANTSDVNTLTGRVTTAEGRITTNAQQIELRATKTDVNTLTGRVSTAEGNITTQAGQIALKANQSVVDTLTGRVSTTESKITATDGKVTTLTTKTEGNTTSIGQLQIGYDGLSSTVTQVKNNLEGMEIGGRNLIVNTESLDGYSYKTSDKYMNFNIARTKKGSTGYSDTFSATTIDIAEGDTYTASFFARTSVASFIVCHWYSPNTTIYAISSTGQVSYGADGGIQVTTSTDWKRYWVTWIQSTTTNVKRLIIGRNTITPEGTLVEISGVKIEKGNKATDWSPAPEDYTTVTAFSALEQNLNGFKTTVANTYADKTQVTQLSNQWTTTTNLVNGHTSQIASLGESINLRVTKEQVTDEILNDKTAIKGRETTNDTPLYYYDNYRLQKVREYKNTTVLGLIGNYSGILETESQGLYSPWTTFKQTFYTTTYTYSRSAIDGSTWGSWVTLVDSSNVLSQINISPESILIASNKIQIKGDTYIDNGVIKTAHIEDLAVSGAKIANASIASAKIISLDASKINVGTLTGHTISGAIINGGSITGTTFHNEGADGNVTIANGRIRAKDFFVRENGALVSETGYIVIRSMLSDVYLQSNSEVRVTSVRSYNEFMPVRASSFIAMSNFYSHGIYEGANDAVFQSNASNVSLRAVSGDVYLRGLSILVTNSAASGYTNIYANAFIGRGGNAAFGTDEGYTVVRSSGDTQPVYLQGNEIRATSVSNAGNYVAVRASAFPTGSLETLKTDIKKYTDSALQIIRDATIYDYKLKEDLKRGRVKTRIGLVIGHGYNTPNEIIDGDGVEQYAMNSLGWKAIQELDIAVQNANKRISVTDSNVIQLVANDSIYGLRLNNLESEVFRLKKRIEELEKIA